MPDLDNLETTRQVVVPYRGADVHITYAPERVTPALMLKVTHLQPADPLEQVTAIADFITTICTGWDIEHHGAPLPLSFESLSNLPISLLADLASCLAKDVGDTVPAQMPGNRSWRRENRKRRR